MTAPPRVFAPGQRVMITEWGTDPICGPLTGYFGHVATVVGDGGKIWVAVEGRIGGATHREIVDHIWPFEADELEHAD